MVKSAGCATYLKLSKKYEEILLVALSRPGCTRVDLIFDQYPSVSVKADERRKRGKSCSLEVIIHGGSARVPKQRAKYISNPKNKENLAEFLCDALSKQLPQHLSSLQKVVLAGGFRDGSKTMSLTQSSVAVEHNLRSDHEEADTRHLLHDKHAANTHPRIVIQSPDTDVAVLSVAYFEELSCQELWFKTGVKDRQRYIPIHDIHLSFGRLLSKCLLSFHALTECDSTSALSGIGKKKAWNVLLKNEPIQQDSASLVKIQSL